MNDPRYVRRRRNARDAELQSEIERRAYWRHAADPDSKIAKYRAKKGWPTSPKFSPARNQPPHVATATNTHT